METYTAGYFLGNSKDYVGELYGKRMVTPVLYDHDYVGSDGDGAVGWFYAVNSCKLGIAYLTTHYINKLKEKGLIIGKGYGSTTNQIRIANFPTHSKEVFELLCDELIKL